MGCEYTSTLIMPLYTRWFVYSITTIAGAMVVALALLLLGSLWPGELGYDIRIVESGSMEPTILTGAVVLTRPAANYEVGDIVTYQRRTDKRATTHRLITKIGAGEEVAFMAQGDANNVADVEPVRVVEIAGKVRLNLPYVGYVLSFFRSPLGFLVLVLIPAILILREQFIRIRRVVSESVHEE
jgi:signal peptidase